MAAKTKIDAYFIRCISHLHAGNGDTEYGIVDKLVQRDPSTGWPTINGSSLKGALREFFEFYSKTRADFVPKVFGSGTQDEEKVTSNAGGKSPETRPGSFDFDSAFLLFLPIRSDKGPNILITCNAAIGQFLERIELFGLKKEQSRLSTDLGTLATLNPAHPLVSRIELNSGILETHENQVKHEANPGWSTLEELAGNRPVALVSDALFGEFTKALPVIARNFLDNGQSKNLWYEEIVPRDSIFYSLVSKNAEDGLEAIFDQYLVEEEHNQLVQIGANATVGYGKCAFTKMRGKQA